MTNEEAKEPPFPVRDGANGATDPDEEVKLEEKFGEPNELGFYGAEAVE